MRLYMTVIETVATSCTWGHRCGVAIDASSCGNITLPQKLKLNVLKAMGMFSGSAQSWCAATEALVLLCGPETATTVVTSKRHTVAIHAKKLKAHHRAKR